MFYFLEIGKMDSAIWESAIWDSAIWYGFITAVIRCLKIAENQQLRNMTTYTLYKLDNLYVIIYIQFYFNSKLKILF
jgi:hypothetical protein